MVGEQRRARQPRLDAVATPAPARGRWPVGVVGAGQRVVPPFAGDRVAAGQADAVDRDAAADTGAEDHAEHDAMTDACAVDRFGQREAVGVVGHADRSCESRGQVVDERPSVEPRRVRVPDHTGGERHGAGHRDADRGGRTELTLARRDEVVQRGERRVVVLRCRDPRAQQRASRVVERDQFDLGPTEVDAEADQSGHRWFATAARRAHARFAPGGLSTTSDLDPPGASQ